MTVRLRTASDVDLPTVGPLRDQVRSELTHQLRYARTAAR